MAIVYVCTVGAAGSLKTWPPGDITHYGHYGKYQASYNKESSKNPHYESWHCQRKYSEVM